MNLADLVSDPEVTLIIFEKDLSLSPGLILSGEYPTKKSVFNFKLLPFSKKGIQISSVTPG